MTSPLITSWMQLWNGSYDVAPQLIAEKFTLHAALMGGGDSGTIDSPEALVGWVTQIRTALPDLRFTVEVGPIVDGDLIALRWRAEGSYAGGMPGAAAPAGTPVDFTGSDLLRVHEGQVAEYWVNSDVHLLFARLQVTA